MRAEMYLLLLRDMRGIWGQASLIAIEEYEGTFTFVKFLQQLNHLNNVIYEREARLTPRNI